jgi:hypothetical protein
MRGRVPEGMRSGLKKEESVKGKKIFVIFSSFLALSLSLSRRHRFLSSLSLFPDEQLSRAGTPSPPSPRSLARKTQNSTSQSLLSPVVVVGRVVDDQPVGRLFALQDGRGEVLLGAARCGAVVDRGLFPVGGGSGLVVGGEEKEEKERERREKERKSIDRSMVERRRASKKRNRSPKKKKKHRLFRVPSFALLPSVAPASASWIAEREVPCVPWRREREQRGTRESAREGEGEGRRRRRRKRRAIGTAGQELAEEEEEEEKRVALAPSTVASPPRLRIER